MRIQKLLALITSVLFINACSTTTVSKQEGDTDTLANLQKLSAPPPSLKTPSGQVNEMRDDALKDVAMTIAAQSALHYQSLQIDQTLTQTSKTLDTVYNFNGLLLDHNVLPPVLSEARQTLNLDGPESIRLADKTYEIVSQAKFVTVAPTWRDYLWMDYPQPPIPDKGILPHTSLEKKLWAQYSVDGWNEGLAQANQIYSENLSRLERDYKGMLLYRQLRDQNIVSAPFVATTELGVTGGGNNLNVNDQVLRITALPALQPNSEHWKPALTTEPQ
jgi:defect in organelle trafficking protein DotC